MATDQSVDDDDLPFEVVKRADALVALRDGSRTRAALIDALGVSRTTVHRLVRALETRGLIEQQKNEFFLTALGAVLADEVYTFRHRVVAARRLQPFLETVADAPVDIDVELFEDAQVTVVDPMNPYAPVERFVQLVEASETLHGFDTTPIAPIAIDGIRDEILGGMTTDVIYLPAVVESIADAYRDEVTTAIEREALTLSTHADLPFGLAIFDDRIGLGGYDDETGMLRAFVDTDHDRAREWAIDLYKRYRAEADPVDLTTNADG